MARVRKFTRINIFSFDDKKLNKTNATNGNEFCVDMANDVTLCCVLGLKLFNFEHLKSLDIASTLADRRVAGVLVALTAITWIISLIIGSTADPFIVIFINSLIVIFAVPVVMNMNFTLLYCKTKSFGLYWKLYIIVTVYIAKMCIRAQFDIMEFNKARWQIHESIFFGIMITSIGLVFTFVISLHQGFIISTLNQFWQITLTVIVIGQMALVGIRAYVQDNMEHDAQIIGVKFSVRNMIISKSFDIMVFASIV